jgi:predicted peptidase
MMVDGLGSSGRSKVFHDVSYKNMGSSLTDHVLAIQQLAEKYPWIDAERVGIFGHSAGGYDAGHALLNFPIFIKWELPVRATTTTEWKKPGGPKCIWAGRLTLPITNSRTLQWLPI